MRIFGWVFLAVLLAGCGGGNNPSPPPPPSPPPAPVSFWAITAGSAPQLLQFNGAPYFDFPSCVSAKTCWVSYVEQPYGSIAGRTAMTLSYSITGDAPVFIHDSVDNTPDGPSLIHLLIRGGGFRAFSISTQPLQLGSGSLTVNLDPSNWIIVDGAGVTVTDTSVFSSILAQVTNIGFCFGGGYFACHGVVPSSGSARFTINGVAIN